MKLLFLLFITFKFSVVAQVEMKYNANAENLPHWAQLMYAENPDEGEVINAYTDYYKKNELVKNKHIQYYKRWLRGISRFSNAKPTLKTSKSSNEWKCVGPWDFDKDAASRSYAPGAAHIYTIEQAASNPNVLYAGSATAGAWKTIDKGDNWNLITQDLFLNGVYAIEIDFTNPEIIYISGNGGIYKSYDGGVNWTVIGNATFTALSHSTKDIKLSTTNNQILFIASDEGLFKSIDGGNNFTLIMNGNFLEIEFHPSNPNTMYFVKQAGDSTLFYRSDNGGNTLTNFTNGWPNPNSVGGQQKRTEIAISPAAPDKIVALATGSANGGSGLYGIYISDDKGENWTFQCCGPQPAGPPDSVNINMMGWQPDGSDDGGQYYYDLGLAVNPTNADIIHVGGVQHWLSFDNGVSFTCPAKWSEPYKKGYVHADIHDINYFGNDLWFACDGGVFYSDNAGDSIYKKQYGIAGADFWGFGAGFKDGEVMLGGTYHNGTMLKDGNTYINDWLCTDGGDGIRGFVNFGNPRVAYSDYGGKVLSGDRTVGIADLSIAKKPNASYITGESSQMEFDPRCYNWNYIGEDTTLWLSKNNGASYSPIYHFNDKVTSVEVAWSNPDVIYVATWPSWWGTKHIYRSSDAGNTWIEITPTNINGQDWIPYDITISSYDENTLWIARCSMYGGVQDAEGYEVFKSVDGGQNWINWSTPTLDNINVTNIEHQRGGNGVYIGTRESVYYRNNSMADWDIYDSNLPKNTYSTQLIPYYREGLLQNGTNRSAYEIDFYENTPPSAQIAADRLEINCMNDTVKFVDHSAVRLSSASWQWSFPGGTPSSSSQEDPVVVYPQPGTYNVSLTVTDAFGTSSQSYADFITYADSISLITNSINFAQDFENSNFPPASWELESPSFSWLSTIVDFGIDCLPTTTAYVNHYWIQYSGEEAYLISNKVSLGNGISAQNWLTYDYAYSGYASGYDDGLRIDISTDCGSTWDSIYGAIGPDLQTVPYEGSAWSPTCGSWASDSINLSTWGLNGDTIMVRFVAINDYGNHFYMDNININGQNILAIVEGESINTNTLIYPNPTKGIFNIRTDANNMKVEVFSTLGRLVANEIIHGGVQQIDLSKQAKGFYFVKLMHKGTTEQRKLVVQ
ncbi:T9SS type A sorting domain-containing protein [Flavobacteriales bacterium]|nr:T9SS type A sorting domain-containing protein [Flavobacteriales bacterium]